jgi:hypothetical protein
MIQLTELAAKKVKQQLDEEKPISWGQWRNKRAEILANLEAAGVNPKV